MLTESITTLKAEMKEYYKPQKGMKLQHGIGCTLHKNCFDCPFSGCVGWHADRDILKNEVVK